jgi:hypothetical protein
LSRSRPLFLCLPLQADIVGSRWIWWPSLPSLSTRSVLSGLLCPLPLSLHCLLAPCYPSPAPQVPVRPPLSLCLAPSGLGLMCLLLSPTPHSSTTLFPTAPRGCLFSCAYRCFLLPSPRIPAANSIIMPLILVPAVGGVDLALESFGESLV